MSLATWDNTLLLATWHKWTHPALTPARSRYSIYLPRRNGRLSWPRWPVTYRDGLPAHRRSPIQVLTWQCAAGSWTRRPVDHKSDALTTTQPSYLNSTVTCRLRRTFFLKAPRGMTASTRGSITELMTPPTSPSTSESRWICVTTPKYIGNSSTRIRVTRRRYSSSALSRPARRRRTNNTTRR